jgi:hypothetical protein
VVGEVAAREDDCEVISALVQDVMFFFITGIRFFLVTGEKKHFTLPK